MNSFSEKIFSLACSSICFKVLAAKDESYRVGKLIEVAGFEGANKEAAEVVGCERPWFRVTSVFLLI